MTAFDQIFCSAVTAFCVIHHYFRLVAAVIAIEEKIGKPDFRKRSFHFRLILFGKRFGARRQNQTVHVPSGKQADIMQIVFRPFFAVTKQNIVPVS